MQGCVGSRLPMGPPPIAQKLSCGGTYLKRKLLLIDAHSWRFVGRPMPACGPSLLLLDGSQLRVSSVSFGKSLPFSSNVLIFSTKGCMVCGLLFFANSTINFRSTLSRFCWFFRFLSKVMKTSKPLKAAKPQSYPFFFPNHSMSMTIRTSCPSSKS